MIVGQYGGLYKGDNLQIILHSQYLFTYHSKYLFTYHSQYLFTYHSQYLFTYHSQYLFTYHSQYLFTYHSQYFRSLLYICGLPLSASAAFQLVSILGHFVLYLSFHQALSPLIKRSPFFIQALSPQYLYLQFTANNIKHCRNVVQIIMPSFDSGCPTFTYTHTHLKQLITPRFKKFSKLYYYAKS